MADNTVTVIGNVTRDPELRFTPSGQAIATFGLAVNRRWQNRQTQEWEENVSFFDVTCWAQLGQNVADTLVKGSRETATARHAQRSWQPSQANSPSKDRTVADEVGPRLRWPPAATTRTERREGGDPPPGGGAGATRPVANEA